MSSAFGDTDGCTICTHSLGAYCLTPAPWISPIVGTLGDIVGDTVRALEQRGAEAAMTSLWSQYQVAIAAAAIIVQT